MTSNRKISELTAAVSVGTSDIVPIVQAGQNYTATVAQIRGVTGPLAADPSATIGLSAVNGAAATFLRSDGAPALSQAIVPTWTGQHTFSVGPLATQYLFTGTTASLPVGSISKTATDGIKLVGATGSSWAWSLGNNAGSAVLSNPVGTVNLTAAGTLTANAINTGSATISGGAITNITDLAVADGGTGASTAAAARTNLGVAGGNLPATATNDNATAGNLGDYSESEILVGSAVSVTSNTIFNVTSLSLPAGDWDVWGSIVYASGAGDTIASPSGWLHTISASTPTIPNKGAFFADVASRGAASTNAFSVGRRRYSLASTTTVYLSGVTFHSGGTCSAYGFIGARRAR